MAMHKKEMLIPLVIRMYSCIYSYTLYSIYECVNSYTLYIYIHTHTHNTYSNRAHLVAQMAKNLLAMRETHV